MTRGDWVRDALEKVDCAHAEATPDAVGIEPKSMPATLRASSVEREVHMPAETSFNGTPVHIAARRAKREKNLWACVPHAPVVSATTGRSVHPAAVHAP